jgi:hypothetical protein
MGRNTHIAIRNNFNVGIKLILASIMLYLGNICFPQNLIINPGFEEDILSASWSIWYYSGSAVALDTVNVYSGNHSVKVTGNLALLFQTITVVPNTVYKISAHIKNNVGQATYFGVKNYGGDETFVYFTDTVYTYDSLYFRTGENMADAEIYIWKQDGTGNAWIDDISMVTDSGEYEPDQPGGQGNYYVSETGNDTNSGVSVDEAWQTINKLNKISFEPGDKILFEGGKTFLGNLQLNKSDAGTKQKKLYIGSFGDGRATINAGTGTAISALGCTYVTIKQLTLVGDGRKNGNTGNGIFLSSCTDFTIDSLDISGFQHSGLLASSTGKNYRFTHINAHDNGYAGIYVYGLIGNRGSQSDIYIAHCVTDNNPGDPTVLKNHSGNGILVFNATNCIIEYCEASNNGWDMPRTGNGPGGIWVAEVDSTLIQYCISHDNKTSAGAQDGVGFDLDGGCTNSVIQYCQSYNNHGSGYAAFQYNGASEWKNNTIRYCISENDGNVSSHGSIGIWNGDANPGRLHNLEFHNNTIYNSQGPVLNFTDNFNKELFFRNNIFVAKDTLVHGNIGSESFQANCWYSLDNNFLIANYTDFESWVNDTGKEKLNDTIVGINANPQLHNPGRSQISDPEQITAGTDYYLQLTSPLIDAGLDLKNRFGIDPGEKDLSGTPVPSGKSTDIGAYECPVASSANETKNDAESLDLQIYPNPSHGNAITISIRNPRELSGLMVSVADLEGRIIDKISIEENTGENLWESAAVARGIYAVSLFSNGLLIGVKKLIIN